MNSAEQTTSNDFAPSKSLSALQVTTPPPPPQLEVSQEFNHQDSKYKCCCGLFHAKIGAMAVAIYSCILLLYLIISIMFINDDVKGWGDWVDMIELILLIPVVICLFIGLFTKNQYLLLPYIFYSIISAILLVISAIKYMYISSTAEPNDNEQKKRMGSENVLNEVIIDAAVLFKIILVLSVTAWFTWVIFLFYRYFRDLKKIADYI
uniref:Uncharacterized protein n=1 Tax=Panagrolaimus sp. PS1159 TaxID=55785 RepID=A0AC35G9D6_9BILA